MAKTFNPKGLTFFIALFIAQLCPAVSYVRISDAGNPPASDGKGSVGYDYEIAATELTNDEYCAFLNCVASETDPVSLYVPTMSKNFMGGILRTKADGRYTYSAKEGYGSLPVTPLSWMNAARYANWLHYNTPKIESGSPVSDFLPIYEGDSTHGAYNTIGNSNKAPLKRNPGAIYWIPDEHEWLKAAYFDGKEWETTGVASDAVTFDGRWKLPYPHLRDAEAESTRSHYGTMNQQGNVAEWIENNRGDFKMAIGGSLIRPGKFARYGECEGDYPDKAVASFGVRLCRDASPQKRLTAALPPTGIPERVTQSKTENVSGPNGSTFVKVGNEGNAGDIVNQLKGSVQYPFYISKYELTNGEYCRFLNAVAAKTDKYNLYSPDMGSGVCGGIKRNETTGGFTYECIPDQENRPVTYITFCDLARYANWLHFGCPEGEQVSGITEGDDHTGAYDTRDFENVRSERKKPYAAFGRRNTGAKFWIPDESEWYKAAYHDPEKPGNRKFHDYPTRTSDAPSLSMANYMRDNDLSVGEPYFTCPVDSFADFPSYCGTLNQGGNVWEWTESWQYGSVGQRALRGGSWQYTEQGLNAMNEDPGGIDDRSYLFGGRLCMAANMEEGFRDIRSSTVDKLERQISLMPKKHLLALIGVLGALSTILLIFIVYKFTRFIIPKLCRTARKLRKKN